MTNSIPTALKFSLILIGLSAFAACGQKGPLQVEQPPAPTQVEEPAETR